MNIDKSLKWITQRINVLILISLFLVEYQQYKFHDCNVIQVPSVLSHIQRCSMDKALGLNNPVCRCPSISSDPTNPGVDFGPKFCHHHSELLARDSWVPRGLIESQNCSGWKSLFLNPAFPSTDYGIHPRAPALLFKLQMSPVAQVIGNILSTPGWAQWSESSSPPLEMKLPSKGSADNCAVDWVWKSKWKKPKKP